MTNTLYMDLVFISNWFDNSFLEKIDRWVIMEIKHLCSHVSVIADVFTHVWRHGNRGSSWNSFGSHHLLHRKTATETGTCKRNYFKNKNPQWILILCTIADSQKIRLNYYRRLWVHTTQWYDVLYTALQVNEVELEKCARVWQFCHLHLGQLTQYVVYTMPTTRIVPSKSILPHSNDNHTKLEKCRRKF